MPNIDKKRFAGFADLYSLVRPQPPQKVVEIALGIQDKLRFERVVDLGSGTGLSTIIWKAVSNSVVGIEPTEDMRNQARLDFPDLDFLDGTSYQTSLESSSADVVQCSQAFHWMEPKTTLKEVDRILKKDGIFIILDCQWPVCWNWVAENAYNALVQKAKKVVRKFPELSESSTQYPKEKHLENIKSSGFFAYCGSVLFDNVEACDARRFEGIALSQGLVQSIVKKDISKIENEIQELKVACSHSHAKSMRVSYVLHYGVKSGT